MTKHYFSTKSLLLMLMLLGGVNVAWADGTISIPQTSVGTYIPIGNASTNPKTTADGVTLTGCQVDGSAETSYTVGSTSGSPMSIELALTAEAGNYLFSFKSGHAQGTAVISLSLKNSSGVEIWNNANVNISNTGGWSLTEAHTFLLGDLEAGNYTMTLTGVSKEGSSYHGNFGNFCFLNETSAVMPNSDSNLLNVSMATTSGMKINGTYLTEIAESSYADNIYFYVSNAAYYTVFAGYGYATAGTDQFTITITDMVTGTAEVNAQNYTLTSSQTYLMPNKISAGWKKLRLDHPIAPASNSYRLEKMYFTAIDALPLMTSSSTTYLDLSKGTYVGDIRYENGGPNIGYVKDGNYAEFYVENITPSYYTMHANIPWHSGKGKFTVTITDVATSKEEATATSASITAISDDATVTISNKITVGLKTVRISFAKDEGTTTTYLFNLKNVTFYQRSLNENYNYSPVAASDIDIELTRTIPANRWATIVLPFNLTADQVKSTFGEGVKLAQLTGVSNDALTFATATTMNANEPYMIRVSSAFTGATISGVTIVEGTPTKSVSGVDFIGSYAASTEIPASDESNTYYFISANQLYKTAGSGTANTIAGTRAYFKVPGATAARLTGFTIGEDATGIGSHYRETAGHSHYYNLQGQRIEQPAKGLYIVNGKKIIIK